MSKRALRNARKFGKGQLTAILNLQSITSIRIKSLKRQLETDKEELENLRKMERSIRKEYDIPKKV